MAARQVAPALVAVAFDQLVHHADQRVQLLGNFEARLCVVTQNVRLVPLHPSLLALNVHNLDDRFLDVLEPFSGVIQ